MYFSLVSPKENATSILLGRCKVLQPSKKSLSSCLSAGAGCFQSVFASFFFRINSFVDLRGEFGLGRVWEGLGGLLIMLHSRVCLMLIALLTCPRRL